MLKLNEASKSLKPTKLFFQKPNFDHYVKLDLVQVVFSKCSFNFEYTLDSLAVVRCHYLV